MTSPLHKFPPGLLEVFQLKQNGDAPNKFGDEVAPSVDVWDLYAADRLALDSAGATGGVNTTLLAAAAPTARRILAMHGNFAFGANVGTWLTLALVGEIPGGGGIRIAFGAFHVTPTVAAGVYRVVSNFTSPLVLPGGHQLGLEIFSNATGVDHNSTMRVLYQRLD